MRKNITGQQTEPYQPYHMRPESGLDIPPFIAPPIYGNLDELSFPCRSYGEFLQNAKGGHFNPYEHKELKLIATAPQQEDLPPFLSHLKLPTRKQLFDMHFRHYKPSESSKN